MKSRIWLGLLAVFLILIMAGCAQSSPTAVVTSLYDAINEGDYDKAVSMFSTNAINTFGINKISSVIEMQAQQVESQGGINSFKVTDEKIVGDNAAVYYEIEFGNGTYQNGSMNCVNEDGKWKIEISK